MHVILEPDCNRKISIFNQKELTPGTKLFIDNEIKAEVISCSPFLLTLKTNSYKINLSLRDVEQKEIKIEIFSQTETA